MPGTPWQEQVAYYRRRAAEYDVTSYEDLPRASRRIAALVGELQPGGDLLEIACGTGIWTRHLVTYARSVTAIDAAPEMIALARQRVTGERVIFRRPTSWNGARRGASTPSSSRSGCPMCPQPRSAGSGRSSALRWPATAARVRGRPACGGRPRDIRGGIQRGR